MVVGWSKWQLSALQLTVTLEPSYSHVVSDRRIGVVTCEFCL